MARTATLKPEQVPADSKPTLDSFTKNIGNVSTLDEAVAAFNSTERRAGKTVIRVRP